MSQQQCTSLPPKTKVIQILLFLPQINGHFVLNSPLEPVIAAMQEAHTVSIVVARAQALQPEPEVRVTTYIAAKQVLSKFYAPNQE